MPLRDELDRVIDDVLRTHHPDAHRAVTEGADTGRGDAAHALQDLQAARNALLDAAARWDRERGG